MKETGQTHSENSPLEARYKPDALVAGVAGNIRLLEQASGAIEAVVQHAPLRIETAIRDEHAISGEGTQVLILLNEKYSRIHPPRERSKVKRTVFIADIPLDNSPLKVERVSVLHQPLHQPI